MKHGHPTSWSECAVQIRCLFGLQEQAEPDTPSASSCRDLRELRWDPRVGPTSFIHLLFGRGGNLLAGVDRLRACFERIAPVRERALASWNVANSLEPLAYWIAVPKRLGTHSRRIPLFNTGCPLSEHPGNIGLGGEGFHHRPRIARSHQDIDVAKNASSCIRRKLPELLG